MTNAAACENAVRMAAEGETIHIRIPIKMRSRAGRKLIVLPDAAPSAQESLVRSVARAYQWQALLDSGDVRSVAALAALFHIDHSYVARTLRLSGLSPEIVEMIANGDEPNGLSLRQLMKGFPTRWDEQKTELCGRRNVSGRGRGI